MTSPLKSFGPKRPARVRDAGVGRLGGLATSAITAGLVFVVGWPLLPRREPPPPAQVAAPVPPPPAPPPVPATASDAAPEARAPAPSPVDATASEAARIASRDARAVAAADEDAAPVPAKEGAAKREEPPKNDKRQDDKRQDDKRPDDKRPDDKRPDESGAAAPSPPAADARKATSPETQADKDLAREAWRKNKPDVSVAGNRAAILIPLKGSAEAGDFKIIKKTRTVVITLPKAASLNTMRFYKLRRDGFVALWIDQAEKNARAEDGTKLKIVLAGQVEPQVELRDDFVRVTVTRPQARPAAPAEAPAEAGDAADSEKE